MSSPNLAERARSPRKLAPSTRPFAPSTTWRALAASVVLLPMLACNDNDNVTAPSPIEQQSNQVILDWNLAVLDVMTAHDEYANGLNAVRVSAMVHTAQHDALNAIYPVFNSYAFEGNDASADPVAAAASAAHGVLLALFPAQKTALDARLAESLEAVADGTGESRGVALGALAAAAIVQARNNDGSDTPLVGGYEPGNGPGKYQLTPPFNIAFVPGWRHVKPFALENPMQFRSVAPPALSSATYTEDFNEVKSVGQLGSTTRTADQTAYAKFWYELSEIGWNRIARTVAQNRELGLQSAVPANGTRSFTSFGAAADENADSRVMAGIHFRFAIEAGQALGRDIGEWTVQNYLQAR